jgi:lysophospholipase L1-like esterase
MLERRRGAGTAVAAFDALYAATVAQLRRDGLRVGLADVAAGFVLPGDLAGDEVHPNDQGHQDISRAFARAYAALGSEQGCIRDRAP